MTIQQENEDLTTTEGEGGEHWELHTCSLCTLPMRHPYIEDDYLGNSAYPLGEGRCCDVCDCLYVIPARAKNLSGPIRAMIGVEIISRFAKIIVAIEDKEHGLDPDDDGWVERYMEVIKRYRPEQFPLLVTRMNDYARTGEIGWFREGREWVKI